MTRVIDVETPGRLHFGLSSFGDGERRFSGLGLMVDTVGVQLRVSMHDTYAAEGPLSQRVRHSADRFFDHYQLIERPECKIQVVSSPPNHVGLGIGTQLGLAVTAALSEWLQFDWRDAELLSRISGRGGRSSVGTHGFLHGGLIVDAGKAPGETLGHMTARVDVPANWRFVLIRQPTTHGLSGESEATAMSSLPPVPYDVTASLQAIVKQRILPAVATQDFQDFSKAIYDYGYQAGECFAPAQGGPFASSAIAELVTRIQELGYPGAGQSSWGPTVFAIAENQGAAEQLVAQLRDEPRYAEHQFDIAAANSTGASVVGS